MKCKVAAGDIFLTTLKTRMPFKYGIATMTTTPHAFVRLRVEINGRTFTGCAADHLPPKWFTKDPQRSLQDEVVEMLRVIKHAVSIAEGMAGANAFDVWRQLFQEQGTWGDAENLPPLLTHFGTSLVERALIEAHCRCAETPFWRMVRENRLGIELHAIHHELQGVTSSELLPERPLSELRSRHTIGMADPIVDEDISEDERLNDGLPQSLAACIRRYGLRDFKIKISGETSKDVHRLKRIVAVLQKESSADFRMTLDGNEQFHSLPEFANWWNEMEINPSLRPLFERLMFVEQPFHRDIALDKNVINDLVNWMGRPPIIIDESDGELSSLRQALQLGYAGASHKNCKGVFKGIANACLLSHNNRQAGERRYIMSGEDLVNIGPIAFLQDSAVCAMLGVESVERNGHHYFAGLSMFPPEIREMIQQNHDDLYAVSDQGWPTMTILDGAISMTSINDAPFGVHPVVPVERFTPADEWSLS